MIGIQLYTLRKYLTNTKDIDFVFSRLNDLNVKILQLSGVQDFTNNLLIEQIILNIKKYKMEIVVTHIPFNLLKNNFDFLVKLHKKLNCFYIGLGAINSEVRGSEDVLEYIKYAKEIDEYALKLREHGMNLVYHNHDFEFEKCGVDRLTYFDILVENTQNVQFELDIFWLQKAGININDMFKRLKGRIDVIHLKDYKVCSVGNDMHIEIRYAALGDGNLDLISNINTAIKCGVKYMLIEQDNTYGIDELDEVKLSLDYLKEVGFGDLI